MTDGPATTMPDDVMLAEEDVDPGTIPGEQDAPEPPDDAPLAPFDSANEQRDLHDSDKDAPDEEDARGPSRVDVKIRRTLKIGGQRTSKIFDFRGVTSPNGGRIELRACVHHIPVIHNVAGRGDLDALRSVLVNEGLMVQFSTDAEGNIAMYTPADRLCFHARGANSFTCGIEHMHFTTDERWFKKQLRAAAWIAQYLEKRFDLPLEMATVEPGGAGIARIVKRGHTSHQLISQEARFNDRTDPGSGFDYEYVFHAARFFKRHGHFVGA